MFEQDLIGKLLAVHKVHVLISPDMYPLPCDFLKVMSACVQAIAKANEQLQNGSFRQVRGGKKVVSELLPATDFYIAEDYHQQYLEKGGRFGRPQNASKGASEPIRCYG